MTIVTETFKTSNKINNGRTLQDVLTHLITEVGELAQEIQITEGKSHKLHGDDGVVGEAIDVITCALDIIKQYDPTINSDRDLLPLLARKLEKWEHYSKVSQ